MRVVLVGYMSLQIPEGVYGCSAKHVIVVTGYIVLRNPVFESGYSSSSVYS